MLKTKTPKYGERFVDRLGHPRFYFRRKLGPRVALPGLPWSLEFMAVYDAALNDRPTLIGTPRALTNVGVSCNKATDAALQPVAVRRTATNSGRSASAFAAAGTVRATMPVETASRLLLDELDRDAVGRGSLAAVVLRDIPEREANW